MIRQQGRGTGVEFGLVLTESGHLVSVFAIQSDLTTETGLDEPGIVSQAGGQPRTPAEALSRELGRGVQIERNPIVLQFGRNVVIIPDPRRPMGGGLGVEPDRLTQQ